MRDSEREGQRHRQREKQAPCREPDVELDPRTPGSHSGLKAGTKPLSHPGIPSNTAFKTIWIFPRLLSLVAKMVSYFLLHCYHPIQCQVQVFTKCLLFEHL